MRPYRTLLEQKIRERRMTLEEFAVYAEEFAREHGEAGTLSLRHLQRLAAGRGPQGQALGPIRPATARLLERIFETDSSELLTSPMQAVAPPDDDAAELRERIQKARRVDSGILQTLGDQLNAIRRLDRQFGAVATHGELLAKISQGRDLLTYSLTGRTRRLLATIVSEMHALAGWQALDMGRCLDSWRHYEQAKQVALETEEVAYHAHAAGEQAFTLIDLGETDTAVEILESAQRTAQRHCPKLLHAWLSAAYGEALAANRDRRNSIQAFSIAEKTLSATSDEQTTPYVALNSTHLSRWYGHALAKLRDPNALNLLVDTLKELDPSFARASCSLRIDLATILNDIGDSDGADKESRSAEHVARTLGSARQMHRLKNLNTHIGRTSDRPTS